MQAKDWWAEPGAVITACTVIWGAIALIHAIDGAALLPALIALLAWVWWIGLLVWRILRGGWRLVVRGRLQPDA